ncbi:5'-nucleotidase [Cystobacter fuscus]|uniref:5'-nucleotidase n=1 Tax=Cystobacter fuscus TaxID=43 RepID=A0A250J9G9_9BACT|nr:5'-nucleotidase [Cystobacter fuscus]ATB40223.1 5'-nucleotidase [Cystobacter fuscus]
MSRPFSVALLALALAPGLGCLRYNDQCQPLVEEPETVLGYLGQDVYLDRIYTRHDNHALGQLAADALRHAEDGSRAPAHLGIINGGALRAEGLCVTRTSIPKGPLKNGLLHEVMLFENSVVTVDLTEKQLVAMFEHSVEGLSPAGQPILAPSGAFLQVSEDVKLRVDCSRPVGQRVQELSVSGRAVPLPPRDNAPYYRVAMSSFLALGGDGYGTIFKDAASDVARNPVTASSSEGRTTDVTLTVAWMRGQHAEQKPPLYEEERVVFENCAKPSRPVVR